MRTYFITDQGKVRSVNEDAGGVFCNAAGRVLAIVADGMGGHNAGEVASGLAVSILTSKWKESEIPDNAEELAIWLEEVLNEANEAIFHRSKESEALEGMGTTVVLAVCSKNVLTVAHVGDSRAYLMKTNKMEQVTSDHSLVNELLRSGQISKEDAEEHPRKNVLLRAVGTEQTILTDIHTIEWQKGDSLLLCSDGLTNKIKDEELQALFEKHEDHNTLGEALVHLANDRGGEDNITLAIVQNDDEKESGDPPC